ncbi:MAG TPA: DUF3999 domain-containing protein [Gammaproteobacteria bacterium]|nr:DUF3999 domain-containing protein [Gammaproteobacteria bacterium]
MKRLFMLIALCIGVTAAAAAEPPRQLKPNDFAWGIPLEVDGDGAIYSLELPEQVYRHVTRMDLGDLRVFNSNNEAVPHMLRLREERQTITRAPIPLKLFPLYSGKTDTQAATGEIPNVHITTDARGTIIDISGGARGDAAQARVVSAYVVDLGMLQAEDTDTQKAGSIVRPDWLEFGWQGAPDSFATTIQISVSDDLNSWRSFVPATTLSQFRFQGDVLERRRIEVSGLHGRYLRISWPAGREGVLLDTLMAGFGETLREADRHWSTASGDQTPHRSEAGQRYFEYDSGGFLPVDRLRLSVDAPNVLTRVAVYSRPDPEAPWRQMHSGLVYRLTVQGQMVANPIIRISPTRHRYWKIELLDEGTALPGPVKLELGWRPHQLLFVASGQAPFRVAYGAVGVDPTSSSIPALLAGLEENGEGFVKTAQAGSEIQLGGTARLETPSEFPWRKLLLWLVLTGGVVVIGFMVMRLVGEMKGSDET